MLNEKERVFSAGPAFSEMLANYSVSSLASLSNEVKVFNGKLVNLQLEEQIKLSAEELIKEPFQLLEKKKRAAVSKKIHGHPRPKAEGGNIAGHFRGLENNLHVWGPGKILAAIALNPDKEAEWSTMGLKGKEVWQDPPEEEWRWWTWVYQKNQDGIEIKKWLENPHTGNLLHALFVMRYRQSREDIDEDEFERFLSDVDTLWPEGVSEEFVNLLREINKKFST